MSCVPELIDAAAGMIWARHASIFRQVVSKVVWCHLPQNIKPFCQLSILAKLLKAVLLQQLHQRVSYPNVSSIQNPTSHAFTILVDRIFDIVGCENPHFLSDSMTPYNHQ